MKLNELTKEQRENIEADELGMNLIKSIINYNTLEDRLKECKIGADFRGIISMLKQEIKRIIKRIDDEIDFLSNSNLPLDGQCPFCNSFYKILKERITKLFKQKQLYELMEQLE